MENLELRQLMAESCGESAQVSADALLLAAALLRLGEDFRESVKALREAVEGVNETFSRTRLF
jgi:hypothetical protein